MLKTGGEASKPNGRGDWSSKNECFGITTEALTRQDAPVFNSTNQQGGSANNCHIHNGDPASESIELLKEQNRLLWQGIEKGRLERLKSEENLQKLLENQQSLQETLLKIMAKAFPEKYDTAKILRRRFPNRSFTNSRHLPSFWTKNAQPKSTFAHQIKNLENDI